VDDATRGATNDELERVLNMAQTVEHVSIIATTVTVADMKELTALADAVRDRLGHGVAVLAADLNGKHTLLAVVTDSVRETGLRADAILKEVAALAGGRGGGKAHLAQAGIPDGSKVPTALAAVVPTFRKMLE